MMIIVKNFYFHLRRLGKIRNLLTLKIVHSIAVSTITSRLDYCNSALWGITDEEIHRLQKIQNSSARIVTRTKSTEHISPILRNLHWLPVKKRLDFKILCLTYLCVNNIAPHYLSDLIPCYVPERNLRSTDKLRLCLPAVELTNKSRSGARSFQHSAPKLWNALPESLKRVKNIELFRKKLKTYLFNN